MNHTPNYQLSQWEPGDQVLRADFNADNAKIDAAIKAVDDSHAAAEAELRARSHLQVLRTQVCPAAKDLEIDLTGIDWSAWQYVAMDWYFPENGWRSHTLMIPDVNNYSEQIGDTTHHYHFGTLGSANGIWSGRLYFRCLQEPKNMACAMIWSNPSYFCTCTTTFEQLTSITVEGHDSRDFPAGCAFRLYGIL